jgi:hypothetical protein
VATQTFFRLTFGCPPKENRKKTRQILNRNRESAAFRNSAPQFFDRSRTLFSMIRTAHANNAARRSSRLAGGASGASVNTAAGRPAARSVRQRIADPEPEPNGSNPTPRAPTPTAARTPNPQAQSDAAIATQRASAAAADAALLQRIEASIVARPNAGNTGATNLAEDTFVEDLTDSPTDIDVLAHRLAAGMFRAASRPDTIPALLRSIATHRHPTVSAYLHTVQSNIGPTTAHPTLAGIITATKTVARCAGHLYGADAFVALSNAVDEVQHTLAKLRLAVDPASVHLHESALARQLLEGLTDPTTDTNQCTIVALATSYVRKATKRADSAKLKALATRAPTYAPTPTPVLQPPAPAIPGTGGRGNAGTKGAGRGNGKGANPARQPWFKSAALNRDTRIPQDANGNNVYTACALCGKGLLPGTTGHRANACPADRAVQDQWVYAGIPAQ